MDDIPLAILQVTGQQWGKVPPVMGNSLPGGNKCQELSSNPTRNETTTRRAMRKLDCIASLLCRAIYGTTGSAMDKAFETTSLGHDTQKRVISGHRVFSRGWGRNNTRSEQQEPDTLDDE